jgi:peptidoglycan L-alanyl-D-glutamate endopeptidase CwlK
MRILRAPYFAPVLVFFSLQTGMTHAHEDSLVGSPELTSPLGQEDSKSDHELRPYDLITLDNVDELKAESFLEAYPQQIKSINLSQNLITYSDGSSEVYNRFPQQRSPKEMIENPDIEDQLFFVYPLTCTPQWQPAINFDPGRIRHEGMLNTIYGKTQSAVERDLKNFRWLNMQSLKATSKNGVLGFFQMLSEVFSQNSMASIKKYVSHSAGTYNRRFIDGTRRLSSHSWGNAMDINLSFSDYWKWEADSNSGRFQYKNRIPCKVVEEFEKLGFIWGGKWHHYDTMHFEYRPELLIFAKKIKLALGR